MYAKLNMWRQTYSQGRPDQRAVGDLIECETPEIIQSFQAELLGIANGNYSADALNNLLGKERMLKHGSWEEWAKVMLLWLASYKK